MDILLKKARIVDATTEFIGDIYIKAGIINKIGKDIDEDCKVLDCSGLIVMPSFIDTHCHFRDPGFTYKEDIYTGSLAALRGGYTAVNLMGNTKPTASNMEIVNYVLDKAKEIGLIDVHQTATITKNIDGIDLDHIDGLNNSVRCLSDDGKGVNSDTVMLQAMLKAKEKGLLLMCHESAQAFEKISMRLSENLMTIRDIELARFSKARIHISHVSTKEAINQIRAGKKNGVFVTCEVTPHHIYLKSDIDYRVNPPLREKEDIDALVEGIKDGTVDCIGTDHAPHTLEDKLKGSPGISGIETAFSVCYTALVETEKITLNKLSEIMSKNSGRILGFNKGEIKVGFHGDLVILDLDKKYSVDSSNFASKGKNTPFDKMKFTGVVAATLKGGKLAYSKPEYHLNK